MSLPQSFWSVLGKISSLAWLWAVLTDFARVAIHGRPSILDSITSREEIVFPVYMFLIAFSVGLSFTAFRPWINKLLHRRRDRFFALRQPMKEQAGKLARIAYAKNREVGLIQREVELDLRALHLQLSSCKVQCPSTSFGTDPSRLIDLWRARLNDLIAYADIRDYRKALRSSVTETP